MDKKPIVLNIIWAILGIILNIAINMVLTPYLTDLVGVEAYGFVSLANTFVSYMDLVISAVNVYAYRFITVEYHKGNYDKANRYFNSVLFADFVFAAVITLIGIPAVLCLERLIVIPDELVADVKILFGIVVINYIITLVGTAFNAAVFIKNQLYRETRVKTLGIVIRIGILLLLFAVLQPHVWYISLAVLAATVLYVIKAFQFTRELTPELHIERAKASIKEIAELLKNGIWNTIAQLGNALNSGLDLIITNLMIDVTSMGQLSIAKSLSSMIESLISAISNSFRPTITKYYAEGESDKLIDCFILAMKTCGLVASAIVCVYAVYGKQFILLWLPNQNADIIYTISVLNFIAETATCYSKPLHYVFVLSGKLKVPCILCLLVGLANGISMFVLLSVTNLGLYAVVWTTIIGNILYNFILMPLCARKILPKGISRIYKNMVRYILVTIAEYIIVRVVGHFFDYQGWKGLFINLIFATLAGTGIYIILMFSFGEVRAVGHKMFNRFLERK